SDEDAKEFCANIRQYNAAHAFTSLGVTIDQTVLQGHGPYCFRINRELCHLSSPLIPTNNNEPAYAQLYIYDAALAHLIRINCNANLSIQTMWKIQNILRTYHAFYPLYQQAHEILSQAHANNTSTANLTIYLHYNNAMDRHRYNLLTMDEIAIILPSNGSIPEAMRDIVIHLRNNKLERIHEGNTENNQINDQTRISRLTQKDFFSFRLFARHNEFSTILRGGKLFQEFIVDAWATTEQNRLRFLRQNQDILRADLYQGLADVAGSIANGELSLNNLSHQYNIQNPTELQIFDLGLFLLNQILYNSNYSLNMFPLMPCWEHNWDHYQGNRLIYEHLNWNHNELKNISTSQELQLNTEQYAAYQNILNSVGNGTNMFESDNIIEIPQNMTIEPELNSLIKSVYCDISIENICTDQYLKDRIILSSHIIIKVKYVKRNEKEDAKVFTIWAIRTYPTGCENNEIEMTLFLPVNPNDRNPESQAIFKKDKYYSVGGKIIPGSYAGQIRPKMTISTSTHLTISNKEIPSSNKCPLKTALIGIPQEIPAEIENTENSIIEILVSDYIGQPYNYTIKVAFPHNNPRFKHLKTTIRPQESTIFVIGQMEIIDNEFYVYANDINYINTNFVTKKKEPNADNTELSSSPTRSKLLNVHQNMAKISKTTSQNHSSPPTLNNPEDITQNNLLENNTHSENNPTQNNLLENDTHSENNSTQNNPIENNTNSKNNTYSENNAHSENNTHSLKHKRPNK
ncbi:4841_t:CDS:2, partial [Cetraspora pellucida]